jgi:hypothetical protein
MSDLKNTIKQQTHLVENLSKTIEKMIEVKWYLIFTTKL